MKNIGISERVLSNGTIKYIAKLYFNKHLHYLGSFLKIEDAINARVEAKKYQKINKASNDLKIVSKQEWRLTKEYRKWKVQCIRRDKVCVLCNSRKNRNVHHIKNGNDHPADRFDIVNGITLCRTCHTQFHCNFKRGFREKCTEDDWDNFILLFKYIKKIK